MTVAAREPSTTAFTVELSGEAAQRLALAAAAHGMSAEALIAEAAERFLEEDAGSHEEWSPDDVEAIERGIAQLRCGEGIPHEQVMAEIKARHGW